jgi:hypothetical protein
MICPPFLAIEKIQSPSDSGGVSNGDQIFSIVEKGIGWDDFFFKNDITCTSPPLLVIEIF